jgi:RES domain-containing protein
MEVFRISQIKWANALVGSGLPARWNSKDNFVVYAAWSRSLACLEHRVHMRFPLKDFAIVTINIPNGIIIEQLDVKSLPSEWESYGPEGYANCQRFGDGWITESKSAVLKLPSAIIPEEFNYLINPNHKESDKIEITSVKPFLFDSRLFK